MSIGGILAFINLKIQDTRVNNALSSIGLGALLITVFIMDDDSLFPGFWAVIPTLSSAFIIQARNESIMNKYILSSKPFVFIGKVSYSWYLWHWPLLVYSRTFYPSGSTSIFGNLYFIVVLSFLMAVLTFYFFENPLRLSKKNIVTIGLIVAMVLIGAGAFYMRYQNYE
jgi:peptidoglycan/LPS O-acetylase OafA/YrhL